MIKVNEVRTLEGQYLVPDLYVLTNEEHWTMTLATHKYAAVAGSFCFSKPENGEQKDASNLIAMPCVQRSSYLNEVTNDFDNIEVDVPDGVDGQTRDMLERCMTTCGRAAGTRTKRRSRAKRKHQSKKSQGTTNNLLKQNILGRDTGLMTKFLISPT